MSKNKKQELLYNARKSKIRYKFPVFLILCEGETEKGYFESIQEDIKSLSVLALKSDKKSILKMAEESIKYRSMKKYDNVFCVFDKNHSTQSDYDKGTKKMKESFIQPIFSNQAFEVWILLHFQDYNTSVTTPNEYLKTLRKYIPRYNKGYNDLDGNVLDLYLKTKGYIDAAIKRADTIKLKNKGHPMNIEPYTDVQELIKKLKEFMF